ncbi:unnamed protein product [Urochloa humidicola]
MPSLLCHRGLLVLLLLLLAAVPPSRGDDAYAVSACRQQPYICGGVNITYPFYLANETKAVPDHDGESYCGYPGLAVTCDEASSNSKAVLKLGNDSYTVSRIDYASLTVSLAAAGDGNGCPIVDHNVTIPASVRLALPISAVEHLFFFINCSFGPGPDAADAADQPKPRPPKPPSIKPITCGGADKAGAVSSFVLPSRDVPPGDWSGACRQIFDVPVLRDSVPRDAQDPKWRKDGYGKAIRAGFLLGWDRSSGECAQCEQDNGKCGYSGEGEFLGCLCGDGHMDGGGCSKTLADSSSLDHLPRRRRADQDTGHPSRRRQLHRAGHLLRQ